MIAGVVPYTDARAGERPLKTSVGVAADEEEQPGRPRRALSQAPEGGSPQLKLGVAAHQDRAEQIRVSSGFRGSVS
jgi:hypothetical protein